MPLRKPLAIITVFYVFGMCLAAFVLGWAIPDGVATILSFIAPTIMVGYYGSSAYEHCNGPKKKMKEEGEGY